MKEAQHGEPLGAGELVVIGVDPHKASVAIEARDTREVLRATGTFPTTVGGHVAMLQVARQWPKRVWAVEGARGVGRAPVARLVARGERVVDVPAKLSARSRVFDTGLFRPGYRRGGSPESPLKPGRNMSVQRQRHAHRPSPARRNMSVQRQRHAHRPSPARRNNGARPATGRALRPAA